MRSVSLLRTRGARIALAGSGVPVKLCPFRMRSSVCAASRGRVSGGDEGGEAASRGTGCTEPERSRRRGKLGGSRFGGNGASPLGPPSEARQSRQEDPRCVG